MQKKLSSKWAYESPTIIRKQKKIKPLPRVKWASDEYPIKKVKRKNDTYAIKTIREKAHLKSVQIYPIFISSCLVCARACYHTPPTTPIHGKHSFLFISILVFFLHIHSCSAFMIPNIFILLNVYVDSVIDILFLRWMCASPMSDFIFLFIFFNI